MLNSTIQTTPDDVLRPKQLVTMLNVSRASIQQLLARGAIKSFRIGTKSQGVFRRDFDAYIAQQQANEVSV